MENPLKIVLESAQKQFLYYKTLGEKSMAQIGDRALFHTANADSNSIAVIVNHLSGNMLSRWSDFLTSDGEKSWRNRDLEFEPMLESRQQVESAWNNGWNCLFKTLNDLTADDLTKIVYIRNEGHSVIEAIQRQLAHYAYHVGQIVFIAKSVSEKPFESLSIPKNKSANYNSEKFSQQRSLRHFTDSELSRLSERATNDEIY